ncbi:MAG: hypothetical protein Ct9H90mP25_0880 [Gammaproteobacteria bacterium]|nr:MAG: hypothetical protein Ct9H90mP25_0880 [Gammaproteobacteria bacterium]
MAQPYLYHSNGFSAEDTLSIIENYPITTMCGAPTIYRMLVLEELSKYNLSSLRHCVGLESLSILRYRNLEIGNRINY